MRREELHDAAETVHEGETLEMPRARLGAHPIHLLADSTRLQLCGPGEWLVGSGRRRPWRKLHIGVDAGTGRIVASSLTASDVDDASQVGSLLDQVARPITSFAADGAYEQDGAYGEIAAGHPGASVIVPPPSSAVPSVMAETAPPRRERHLQTIAERGRMGWQKASGYDWRTLVEADVAHFKGVTGGGLRSRTGGRRATEMAAAVTVLNRMLELGRAEYVRLA